MDSHTMPFPYSSTVSQWCRQTYLRKTALKKWFIRSTIVCQRSADNEILASGQPDTTGWQVIEKCATQREGKQQCGETRNNMIRNTAGSNGTTITCVYVYVSIDIILWLMFNVWVCECVYWLSSKKPEMNSICWTKVEWAIKRVNIYRAASKTLLQSLSAQSSDRPTECDYWRCRTYVCALVISLLNQKATPTHFVWI